ncbi:MAG: glycosyltransferase [Clostridia bacterium]|nr:glycosyltransferase [Clostridia bacterium]
MILDLKENNIKVLVCSVNAWNSKVGDNTFPLLLNELPSANVASLFIREEQPDSTACDHYFRISEPRVIRSIIKRSTKTGECVTRLSSQNTSSHTVELAEHNKLYSNKQKKRFYYLKLLIREIIWKFGKWNTPEFESFLDSFKPDVVIYEMSRYIHLNRIVRYILNRTGAAGIGCFWDDTFTYKQERRIGYKILRFFQRKNLVKLAKETKEFFAITPKTKSEADAFFKIDCTVLTKPIVTASMRTEPSCIEPIRMLYTGNLAIGREKTILSLVKELGKVNRDGVKIRLDIYTKTQLDDAYIAAYNTEYSCLHAAITQEEVIALQNQSDVLLFAESFDDKEKIARLSFSTKITDYYAAGKCIFAVGNADLAPMELFAGDNSAIIVTNEHELFEGLNKLLDKQTILHFANRAYQIGREKYTSDKIKRIFHAVLMRAYSEK